MKNTKTKQIDAHVLRLTSELVNIPLTRVQTLTESQKEALEFCKEYNIKDILPHRPKLFSSLQRFKVLFNDLRSEIAEEGSYIVVIKGIAPMILSGTIASQLLELPLDATEPVDIADAKAFLNTIVPDPAMTVNLTHTDNSDIHTDHLREATNQLLNIQ